ncbi:MAG: hypothetical protein A2Y60_03760 [Chloroflexi bacterium RBG_13_54_9]|nr:MAG: hypothetical protein A2Y60_03760 [Chloroflexi bacterium RBG_13_54_9]
MFGINFVREYHRLVVFRWGRLDRVAGPGFIFVVPIMESATRVDLREFYLEIPHQTCITRDNAPIDIDFLIYMRVLDAKSSVIEVANFVGASQGMATTTLRAVIGDIMLDDVLAKREEINQVLRVKLDEVTERWGIKVTSVEIREIIPPRPIQDAMNRQMAAERERRAVVIEAEGKRQATIAVAEGDKQAAILRAEGERQATILTAEAERQAKILTAEGERQQSLLRGEGFSLGLEKIYNVAKEVDVNTMGLQYLDALKAIGASPASKWILPLEVTGLIKSFANMGNKDSSTD